MKMLSIPYMETDKNVGSHWYNLQLIHLCIILGQILQKQDFTVEIDSQNLAQTPNNQQSRHVAIKKKKPCHVQSSMAIFLFFKLKMNTLFSRIHFSLIHMIRLMKPLCFIFDLLDYDQHKECVVYNNQVIPLR